MLHPSILAADFSNLRFQLDALKKAGFEIIHCDIMDGHFVPNLTFGSTVLQSLGRDIQMDVHLMVKEPENFVEAFKDLPLECITFHIEATNNAHRLAQHLKSFGCKVGIALNPATHESTIVHLLPIIDLILVMTVNPGFGGQSFIKSQLGKIHAISQMIQTSQRDITLQVDGGISDKTIQSVKKAGANCFVAGSYIFEAFKHENFHQKLIERKQMLSV